MPDVKAAVLQTALVHAGQILGQILEHAIMHRFTVTLATAAGVPMFEFLKAVQ
ncbi:hypothetical protein D3C86_2079580 [compost metagenome]